MIQPLEYARPCLRQRRRSRLPLCAFVAAFAGPALSFALTAVVACLLHATGRVEMSLEWACLLVPDLVAMTIGIACLTETSRAESEWRSDWAAIGSSLLAVLLPAAWIYIWRQCTNG